MAPMREGKSVTHTELNFLHPEGDGADAAGYGGPGASRLRCSRRAPSKASRQSPGSKLPLLQEVYLIIFVFIYLHNSQIKNGGSIFRGQMHINHWSVFFVLCLIYQRSIVYLLDKQNNKTSYLKNILNISIGMNIVLKSIFNQQFFIV